jgi:hypothetical protein
MKTAPWLLLVVALVFIIYLTTCRVQAPTVPESNYATLKKQFNDTVKTLQQFRLWSDSAIGNATAIAVQNGESAMESKSELDHERKKVKSLLVLLDSADRETPNSSWVQVSPNYRFGCDSLRKVAVLQDTLISHYEQDIQAYVNSLGYETQIRDSALKTERMHSNGFQQQVIHCMNALNDAEKAMKRRQLYAGMAAWGNRLSPLGGGEINLSLKTKKDAIYELKGAYLNQWWIGVGVKFKLSLK